MTNDSLVIGGRAFTSRLLVGTGKFSSNKAMVEAMQGSGCEIVTVALRRVDIENPGDSMLSHIDRDRYLLLPNTSGARDAEEAVRLARAAGTLETLYLARGDFLGMNGNYAAGILEGCVHFFPETKAWIEG